MMRALSKVPLALLVSASAVITACQPWYRDAETAGRHATDHKHADKLIAQADAARTAGDHARAEALLRRAISDVPDQTAVVYLSLATESFAAGDVAGGRAAARRGMQLWPNDGRFQALLVDDKIADDFTALAIDETGATTFDAAVASSSLFPYLDPLRRALQATHADTAAGELSLWLAHYGIPDHELLWHARDEVADRIERQAQATPSLAGLAHAAERADAELAAGHVARALALYGEVYRLLPRSVLDSHFAGFAKAAQQATDPESIDAGAYALAIQGNKDAEGGLLGLAIHDYRKVIARAPWWIDAHRNLAALYSAAGMRDMAANETAFAERLSH